MRLWKTFATAFAVTALAACSTTATLYPVDGPLAKQQPLPVLTATVDGIMGNTGGISLSLPDGERCTGSGTANGSGVAKDNKGNVFKVLF